MTELNNNKDMKGQEFVREQIKEKPISRKRLQRSLLESALCGAVFALAAGLVFFIGSHLFSGGGRKTDSTQHAEGSSEVTEQQEEREVEASEMETESDSAEMDEADSDQSQGAVADDVTGGESPAEPEEGIIYEVVSLTLQDYQKLKNEMYSIGEARNRSVVTITSVISSTDWFNNTYETEDIGTGVIVAENEEEFLILTERGAIPNEDRIYVSFWDETTMAATVKASDQNTGIAIISAAKADMETSTINSVSTVEFSKSGYVRNGQLVIALGSPLGTPGSIVTGTITSKDKEISRIDNNFGIYTTDIAGNTQSSGVLINLDGQVIGLIMQDFNVQSTGNLTAVPIMEVEALIELLIQGQEIPYAGLYLNNISDKIARANNLPKGIYVREVVMDSPAMEAGLQSGDVIIEIDGKAAGSVSGFYSQLLNTESGKTVTVTVSRLDGEERLELDCQIVLGTIKK